MNDIFIPDALHDLLERKYELEALDYDDAQAYAELWRVLADDFDALYPGSINGEKCRRRAEHYGRQ